MPGCTGEFEKMYFFGNSHESSNELAAWLMQVGLSTPVAMIARGVLSHGKASG